MKSLQYSMVFKNQLLRSALFLFFAFVTTALPQLYQVPPVYVSETEYIRLNSIHQILEPNIPLRRVYKRQVYKYNPESQQSGKNIRTLQQFQPCNEQSAEVEFDPIGYYPLIVKDQRTKKDAILEDAPYLIYDYETLKSSQKNIVDMMYYGDHVFTINSYGTISIYKVDEKSQQGIELKKFQNSVDWTQLVNGRFQKLKQIMKEKTGKDFSMDEFPEELKFRHIQKGYFELMDQTQLIIFCNGELLIGIDVRTLKTHLLSQDETIEIQINLDHVAEENGDIDNEQGNGQDDDQDEDYEDDSEEDKDQQDTSQQQEQDEDEEQVNSFDYQEYKALNNDYTIKVKREYRSLEHFESVAKIDQNHFAVLDKRQGLFVYKIIKTPHTNTSQVDYKIQLIDHIDKSFFGSIYAPNQKMNLVDIKFSPEKGLLLVLDYEKGVFAFERGTKEQLQPHFVLNSNKIIKKQCNLMEYSATSQYLYLSCNKIHRFSLMNWPLVQQKTYPHPMIHIRQIFPLELQNIIVFAGSSTFKLLYLDKFADYYQDEMLDKIIFYDSNKTITANEYGIFAYNYKVHPSRIVCETEDENMLGAHSLMFRTTAECPRQPLSHIDLSVEQTTFHPLGDTCVYTAYKIVYFWKQGLIPLNTMIIIFVISVVLCGALLVWILTTNFRTWRARKYLQFLSVTPSTTHATLVEESTQKNSKHNSSNDIPPVQYAQTAQQMNKVSGSLSSDLHSQQKPDQSKKLRQ